MRICLFHLAHLFRPSHQMFFLFASTMTQITKISQKHYCRAAYLGKRSAGRHTPTPLGMRSVKRDLIHSQKRPTWGSGVSAPYADTMTLSNILGEGRPVLIAPSASRVFSTCSYFFLYFFIAPSASRVFFTWLFF